VAARPVGRVALMSIHPEFADAILSGAKTVEFRKHRIADDVTHVVIYVTQPVAAVVGIFEVAGQLTTSPSSLWRTFRSVAGISRHRFFDYFGDRDHGTGIAVRRVYPFATHLSLADSTGVRRPPQSFQYLSADQGARVLLLAGSPTVTSLAKREAR
jgi:predicted transcriptional regulator